MGGSSLRWDVSLPQRGSGGARLARPRARLSVQSEEGGAEELEVPVAVGRKLSAALDDGAPSVSTRAELMALIREVSASCGRARVEDLIGRRELSCADLSSRLREDGYAASLVEELVCRARECGLVDDARFGAAFARSKALCGWGRLRVERELARHGVSTDDVEGWPEEFFPEGEERERALALASRRRLTGKNDVQRIMRFLCGRGFSVGLASSVAREVVEGAR